MRRRQLDEALPTRHRRADRTTGFQPAARARRFFCFFLKAARLRAVFLLRFFSGMAVSYRLEELRQCSVTSIDALGSQDPALDDQQLQ
jgi:hypothetical protein